MQTKQCLAILAVLALGFGFHNYSIYTGNPSRPQLSKKALHGQRLWQDNNCFSCHQLYGLGGYLGPDLTNTASEPGKGPEHIKAMLSAGIKSMPRFDFTPNEKEAIARYLSEVDATGYYPNYDAQFDADGWVQIQEK